MLIPRQVRETLIRQQEAQDESGAVLILALIFLVAVSLIVTGLLTFAGTSLNATGSFATRAERGVHFHQCSEPGNSEHPLLVRCRLTSSVPQQRHAGALRQLSPTNSFGERLLHLGVAALQLQHSRLYVLCLPFLGRCQCRHGLCRESAAAGHRCLRRLSTRGRFASTDPERLYADCAAGEPSERSGKWLLWREHDPDQLAMESRGARDHLPLLLDWAHDRGNHGHDQRDGIHQW